MISGPPSHLEPSGSQPEDLTDSVQLRGGIIIDDVHRVRVLDPQVTKTSEQLKAECSAYVDIIESNKQVTTKNKIVGLNV
ncbi:hypothetical protein M8J77_008292 [Diaphorina citri]|nr:hypothetical protein M8J77_008292 [Diaphorina citri]